MDVGDVIHGRYRLQRELGRGAMGAVFEAEQDNGLGWVRPVAIKLIRKPTPDTIARFRREADVLARLRHPNTLRIFDYGQARDGTLFVVTELLEGASLDFVVKRQGPLAPKRVFELIRQLLYALEEAHRQGVIHRDVKPQNLFLQTALEPEMLTLLDFGIAKSASHDQLTAPATVLGTPAYMAPEQIRGEAPTPATDIYGVGATVFKLLLGKPMFSGRPLEVMRSQISSPAPIERLGQRIKNLPAWMETWVAQCVQKSPEDRFSSALAAAQAISQQLESARAPELAPQAAPQARDAPAPAQSEAVFDVQVPAGLEIPDYLK